MAVYEIAGLRVKAEPPDGFAREFMEAYRVDADCCDREILIGSQEMAFEQRLQPNATASTLYISALCRAFSKLLLSSCGGILLHSAAMIYKEKAYLFVAPSGTGKTTHILLWKKCLGDRVQILNGDKPFLRVREGRITVYGSPWQGKEGFGQNASCPLGGIYLLNRGAENAVRPAAANEAIQPLLRATLIPEDAEGKCKVLDILETAYRTVPVRILHCNMDDEAVYTVLADIEKEECYAN